MCGKEERRKGNVSNILSLSLFICLYLLVGWGMTSMYVLPGDDVGARKVSMHVLVSRGKAVALHPSPLCSFRRGEGDR